MDVQSALKILELGRVEHPHEIRDAYRRMVKQWHPDQFADRPDIRTVAEDRLKLVNLAHQTLNQYIKKQGVSSLVFNKTSSPDKQKNHQPGEGQVGTAVRLKNWFRRIIRLSAAKRCRRQNSAARHRVSTRRSVVHRSGIDSSLRKTVLTRKRSTNDTHRSVHRVMPFNTYRRHATPSRVEGVQPISPVRPIRPVSGVDSIDGFE